MSGAAQPFAARAGAASEPASQANTARLLAENPYLARLKELEMLKEVLAGTSATFVFGEGDLTTQVRSLVTQKGA